MKKEVKITFYIFTRYRQIILNKGVSYLSQHALQNFSLCYDKCIFNNMNIGLKSKVNIVLSVWRMHKC